MATSVYSFYLVKGVKMKLIKVVVEWMQTKRKKTEKLLLNPWNGLYTFYKYFWKVLLRKTYRQLHKMDSMFFASIIKSVFWQKAIRYIISSINNENIFRMKLVFGPGITREGFPKSTWYTIKHVTKTNFHIKKSWKLSQILKSRF